MRLIAALAAMPLACTAVYAQGVTAFVNKQMPAWTMKTIDGKTISNSTTKGKVVLLDFWASWCGPCKQASPSMQEFHAAYASKGLVVVGANALETKPGPDTAKKYKAEHKFSYTFAHGADKVLNSVKGQGLPTFIVINKQGKIVFAAGEWTPKVKAGLSAAIKSAIGAK